MSCIWLFHPSGLKAIKNSSLDITRVISPANVLSKGGLKCTDRCVSNNTTGSSEMVVLLAPKSNSSRGNNGEA